MGIKSKILTLGLLFSFNISANAQNINQPSKLERTIVDYVSIPAQELLVKPSIMNNYQLTHRTDEDYFNIVKFMSASRDDTKIKTISWYGKKIDRLEFLSNGSGNYQIFIDVSNSKYELVYNPKIDSIIYDLQIYRDIKGKKILVHSAPSIVHP